MPLPRPLAVLEPRLLSPLTPRTPVTGALPLPVALADVPLEGIPLVLLMGVGIDLEEVPRGLILDPADPRVPEKVRNTISHRK